MSVDFCSVEINNFNVKVECSIWWDGSWMTSFPICVIRWSCNTSFHSFAQLNQSFFPGSDYFSFSNCYFESFSCIILVEFCPILECSSVTDSHSITISYESTTRAFIFLFYFERFLLLLIDIFLFFFLLTSVCWLLATFSFLLFLFLLFPSLFLFLVIFNK